MRASICCIAALIGAMGIATDVAAVGEADAGLAGKRGPLLFATGQQAAAMEERGQNARPAPVVHTSQQTSAQREHVLGVCDVVNVNGNGQVSASPMTLANAYFRTHDATIDPGTAKITILQQPKHGYLQPDSRGDWRYAIYIPNDAYLGDDSFVIQVEGSGYTVKLKYFIAVTNDFGLTENPNPICKGQIWKISQDASGTPTLPSSHQLPVRQRVNRSK